MGFCGKCGANLEDGAVVCSVCGAGAAQPVQQVQSMQQMPSQQAQPMQQASVQGEQPMQQAPAQKGAQATMDNIGDKLSQLNNTADTTDSYEPADIENNKVMALLAYIGPLVLITIFAAKDSRYARFHANQGLVLCIAEIAYSIIYSILSVIILAISWKLFFITGILGLVSIAFLVLAVIGIINVLNGKAKELPVVGKYKILK